MAPSVAVIDEGGKERRTLLRERQELGKVINPLSPLVSDGHGADQNECTKWPPSVHAG